VRARESGRAGGQAGSIPRAGTSGKSPVDAAGLFLRPCWGPSDSLGDSASKGHNLIGDGTGGTGLVDGVVGDQVGTSGSPIDPRLGVMAFNGGPTLTHALERGSPALNVGTCTAAPTSDPRGWARPDRRYMLCDVGAYELGVPVFVPVARRKY
jgi:hypothetical protein